MTVFTNILWKMDETKTVHLLSHAWPHAMFSRFAFVDDMKRVSILAFVNPSFGRFMAKVGRRGELSGIREVR